MELTLAQLEHLTQIEIITRWSNNKAHNIKEDKNSEAYLQPRVQIHNHHATN